MKTKTTQVCALVASITLINAGYGDSGSLPPNASFEPMAAVDGEEMLFASNIPLMRTIQTQTTLIHHIATAAQRKVAQERAVTYYKSLPKEKKVALKKKKVRYLAVDTEKNKETSPKAKKVIMIWDTESESLVGKNVYDLPAPPVVGSTDVFETYSAQYIGPGGGS